MVCIKSSRIIRRFFTKKGRRFRKVCLILIAGLPVTFFSKPVLAECPAVSVEARQFVADFGNRAIKSLTDWKIPPTVREERFDALLEEGFDVKAIGRFVLGRHWRRLTDSQKQKFLTLFRRMITKNYAARFSEFEGVAMQAKSAECVDQGGVNVTSVITLPRGGQACIVWKTFPNDKTKKFKVVDVVIDNVSMSITQRSEFDHSIQKLGNDMDAFLADLERRVQRTDQKTMQSN
jgi:phospholipid transport system substrate-binding protein